MIAVEVTERSLTGRRIAKDLHRRGQVVGVEEYGAAPEGYMTGSEFERRCIANISKFYHEKGLLQRSDNSIRIEKIINNYMTTE